jgi:hypothetical protein
VYSAQNSTDEVIAASMLVIDSKKLFVEKKSIFIPPLVPGTKFEGFQQLMSKKAPGELTESHTIQLRFGEEEMNIEVPEFIG